MASMVMIVDISFNFTCSFDLFTCPQGFRNGIQCSDLADQVVKSVFLTSC